MRKLVLMIALPMLFCVAAVAQDARLAGVWKYHDQLNDWWYIRIDIEDGDVCVSSKVMGQSTDGNDFQVRWEAENVVVNSDGSISFDVYKDKKTYSTDDHLYWTIWTHFTVKYKVGRLQSTEKTYGLGYNSNGCLVEDISDRSTRNRIYHNEKDNW